MVIPPSWLGVPVLFLTTLLWGAVDDAAAGKRVPAGLRRSYNVIWAGEATPGGNFVMTGTARVSKGAVRLKLRSGSLRAKFNLNQNLRVRRLPGGMVLTGQGTGTARQQGSRGRLNLNFRGRVRINAN